MASNPASTVGKFPLLCRLASTSCKSSPYFLTSVKIRRNPLRKVCGSGTFLHSTSSLNYGTSLGFRQLETFRFFSVSNNGGSGGGSSGYNGGLGGGYSGDGSGGGGKKWSFLSWYLSLLEKYPVWTKAITSAILTFIGDITCQLAVDQVSSLDWKRTFLFTFMGLALVGPTLHFWYLYLSKLVATPGGSGAFFRLLLDQFLFSPIFIGFFLSALVTLEGRPAQVIPKLEQEWFSSVLANWQLWIPFQFLNFRFVPQQFQVLAANFIALIWNVILSYKAHKEVLAK